MASYRGKIRFHIGKETYEFEVETVDPDPNGGIRALALLRKSRTVKGTGPGGVVEAKIVPLQKPEGIALKFERHLAAPVQIAIEFLPAEGKPVRLPRGKDAFKASVQTLER